MNKIKLQIKQNESPEYRKHSRPIKFALPYFKNNSVLSKSIHIVRSATHHEGYDDKNEVRHISLSFWCGNSSFLHRGKMFSDPPDGEVFCATCLGRAIGAGVFEERIINGRYVLFSPRK